MQVSRLNQHEDRDVNDRSCSPFEKHDPWFRIVQQRARGGGVGGSTGVRGGNDRVNSPPLTHATMQVAPVFSDLALGAL